MMFSLSRAWESIGGNRRDALDSVTASLFAKPDGDCRWAFARHDVRAGPGTASLNRQAEKRPANAWASGDREHGIAEQFAGVKGSARGARKGGRSNWRCSGWIRQRHRLAGDGLIRTPSGTGRKGPSADLIQSFYVLWPRSGNSSPLRSSFRVWVSRATARLRGR